jgi:hypothetical protein
MVPPVDARGGEENPEMMDQVSQKYFSANETRAKIFFERAGSGRKKFRRDLVRPREFF